MIRGDNPNEMGDNLPAINLGSGRAARVLSRIEYSPLRYFGQ